MYIYKYNIYIYIRYIYISYIYILVSMRQSRLFTDRTPYNTIDFKADETKRWDCFTL